MEDIQETVLKKGRFYVRVSKTTRFTESSCLVPRAVYVWLKGNPGFEEIPRGYVIHHLDYDPTNDDISNLVLMCRPHHSAHHLKQNKVNNLIITVDETDLFTPKCKPRAYLDGSKQKWIVRIFQIKGSSTRGKPTTISNYMGQRILTKEDAEMVANDIWERYGDMGKWAIKSKKLHIATGK